MSRKLHSVEKRALRTVAAKEKAVTKSEKPWVAKAIKSGKSVPTWIAALPTEKEFSAMMKLRAACFN